MLDYELNVTAPSNNDITSKSSTIFNEELVIDSLRVLNILSSCPSGITMFLHRPKLIHMLSKFLLTTRDPRVSNHISNKAAMTIEALSHNPGILS